MTFIVNWIDIINNWYKNFESKRYVKVFFLPYCYLLELVMACPGPQFLLWKCLILNEDQFHRSSHLITDGSEKSLHTKPSLSFKFELRSDLVETRFELGCSWVQTKFKLSKKGLNPSFSCYHLYIRVQLIFQTPILYTNLSSCYIILVL